MTGEQAYWAGLGPEDNEPLMPPAGNLDSNIDALERAADGVREVFDFDTIKRFYHLTLLECAERMPVADFAQCVEVAREQLRRSE